MAYFHYTSRQRAQEIMSVDRIDAGPSGKIYLATELYVTGAAAADALSIIGKPAEVAIMIADNPTIPNLTQPSLVGPVIAPTGRPIGYEDVAVLRSLILIGKKEM